MLGINVVVKKLLSLNEFLTSAKFNAANFLTLSLSGAVATSQLENRSVTSVKAEMGGPWFQGTDTGTATAHAVAIQTALTDYVHGMMVFYRAAVNNTGAAITITITGDGGAFATAKSLKGRQGSIPRAGDIKAGYWILARYNSSSGVFEILSVDHTGDIAGGTFDGTSTADAYVIMPTDDARGWGTLTEATGKLLLLTAEADNTGAMTLNYALQGVKAMRTPDDVAIAAGQVLTGMQLLLTYNPAFNSAAGAWVVLSPLVQPDARVIAPVRQTVLSGPVDSNGHPVLLTFSGQDVTLKATADDPLVAVLAAGFDVSGAVDYEVRLTADVADAWTIPTSDGTYFLFIDRDSTTGAITYGYTTTRPIYVEDDGAAITGGLHTFLKNRMKMYLGDGAASAEKQRVFVGECLVASSVISTVTSYMFSGRYQTATDQTIALTNATYTDTHKLGLRPKWTRWVLVNQAAEGDIAQNDEMDIASVTGASTGATGTGYSSEVFSKLSVMWSTYGPQIYEPSSGTPTLQNLVAASWKLRLYAERGW